MTSKHYELTGIGTNVELGKRGPRLKNSSGVIEHRNQADDGYVIVRGGHPVNDNDLVTKFYLETRADVRVTGQIDGGSPPAAGTPGRVFICTTAGGVYTLGYLYRDDGAQWVEIVPAEGLTVVVTDDLSGGTEEYTGDHAYLWDEDTTSWIDLGPSVSAVGVVKTARANFTYSDVGANLVVTAPANAVITKVILNVTQAWDASGVSAEVGDATDPDRHMSADGNDLAKVGVYVVDCGYLYGVSTAVNLTLANNGGTPTQGQARVIVHYDIL
jgi:hypothetical protein